jgi:signal transduction histidine kinase
VDVPPPFRPTLVIVTLAVAAAAAAAAGASTPWGVAAGLAVCLAAALARARALARRAAAPRRRGDALAERLAGVRDVAFRHAAELAAVADVTRRLPATADVGAARAAVCEAAVDVCGAMAAFLLEPAPDGALQMSASAGAVPDEAVVVPLAPAGSPAAEAFAIGEALFVGDVADHPAAPCLAAVAEAGSALLQPVRRNGLSAGVLAVAWSRPQAELDARTAAIMALFAAEAAVAIERADSVARQEELNRMLAEQVEALRVSDQVKSDFVASVSHELRTPLASILGYLDVLREGIADAQEHEEFLEIMDHNARRLLSLINDLLALAAIEDGRMAMRPAACDLGELVAACVRDQAHDAAAKDVRLRVALPGDPLEGTVDGERLAQVLGNLIANAVKFTPAGGEVAVELAAAGDAATLTVADTGVGIPADEADRLFDRFFRASNVRQAAIPGTGLGLAISRAIVEGHGGEIACTSRLGEGSTFTVTLPLAAPARAALAA